MRLILALATLTLLAACGVDGAPVPPGSGVDPRTAEAEDEFFT